MLDEPQRLVRVCAAFKFRTTSKSLFKHLASEDPLMFASSKKLTALAVGVAIVAGSSIAPGISEAQTRDKVTMGLFIASSAMPYFIARERGYFAAENLEVEGIPLANHPLIVQGLVKGDLDTASNLLSVEGANINAIRPNTLHYFSINCQNEKYQVESYVVPPDSKITKLSELKGKRIFSAPGPGNLFVAKGVLKAVGLDEKDYSMQEQQMNVHMGAIKGGQFDAGYTLEPVTSMMVSQGLARRLEVGLIAKYMLGRNDACAVLAGGVMSAKFLKERPQVAERLARAWAKALNDGNNDPKARDLLSAHMNVSPSITATVPLSYYNMVKDLKPAEIADFQNLVDQATAYGLVKSKIDVRSFLKTF
jgi:NitT/TauT family transport system substrate-binding protein